MRVFFNHRLDRWFIRFNFFIAIAYRNTLFIYFGIYSLWMLILSSLIDMPITYMKLRKRKFRNLTKYRRYGKCGNIMIILISIRIWREEYWDKVIIDGVVCKYESMLRYLMVLAIHILY